MNHILSVILLPVIPIFLGYFGSLTLLDKSYFLLFSVLLMTLRLFSAGVLHMERRVVHRDFLFVLTSGPLAE